MINISERMHANRDLIGRVEYELREGLKTLVEFRLRRKFKENWKKEVDDILGGNSANKNTVYVSRDPVGDLQWDCTALLKIIQKRSWEIFPNKLQNEARDLAYNLRKYRNDEPGHEKTRRINYSNARVNKTINMTIELLELVKQASIAFSCQYGGIDAEKAIKEIERHVEELKNRRRNNAENTGDSANATPKDTEHQKEGLNSPEESPNRKEYRSSAFITKQHEKGAVLFTIVEAGTPFYGSIWCEVIERDEQVNHNVRAFGPDENLEQIVVDARWKETRGRHTGFDKFVYAYFDPRSFTGRSCGLALAIADKRARYDPENLLDIPVLVATGDLPIDGHGKVIGINHFKEKLSLVDDTLKVPAQFIFPKANRPRQGTEEFSILERIKAKGIICRPVENINNLSDLWTAPEDRAKTDDKTKTHKPHEISTSESLDVKAHPFSKYAWVGMAAGVLGIGVVTLLADRWMSFLPDPVAEAARTERLTAIENAYSHVTAISAKSCNDLVSAVDRLTLEDSGYLNQSHKKAISQSDDCRARLKQSQSVLASLMASVKQAGTQPNPDSDIKVVEILAKLDFVDPASLTAGQGNAYKYAQGAKGRVEEARTLIKALGPLQTVDERSTAKACQDVLAANQKLDQYGQQYLKHSGYDMESSVRLCNQMAIASAERIARLESAIAAAKKRPTLESYSQMIEVYDGLKIYDRSHLETGVTQFVETGKLSHRQYRMQLEGLNKTLRAWRSKPASATLFEVISSLDRLLASEREGIASGNLQTVKDAMAVRTRANRKANAIQKGEISSLRWFVRDIDGADIPNGLAGSLRRLLHQSGLKLAQNIDDSDIAITVSLSMRSALTNVGQVNVHGAIVNLNMQAAWTVDNEVLFIENGSANGTSTLSAERARDQAYQKVMEKVVSVLSER